MHFSFSTTVVAHASGGLHKGAIHRCTNDSPTCRNGKLPPVSTYLHLYHPMTGDPKSVGAPAILLCPSIPAATAITEGVPV